MCLEGNATSQGDQGVWEFFHHRIAHSEDFEKIGGQGPWAQVFKSGSSPAVGTGVSLVVEGDLL